MASEITHIPISDPAPVAPVSPAGEETSEVKTNARTIILCFDGTGKSYDAKLTNVVKLYSLLRKDSKNQLCYYQAGVGTYSSSRVIDSIVQRAALFLDQAIAYYLHQHVVDGYKFLMQNYDFGDRVCLFGFSRGAYTARALAGMLSKVGLLSKDNVEQIPFAYRLYRSAHTSISPRVLGFKKTFCRPVPIDFLGVCTLVNTKSESIDHRDTVASLGVVMGRSLPFIDINSTIRVFRQAVSLDEHRTRFRPNLYYHGVLDKAVKPHQTTTGGENPADVDPTDVKEVWFAGCHCDVGGGNKRDNKKPALADIPLRWMVQEIKRTNTQIMFDYDEFAQWNIPVTIGEDLDKSIAKEQGGVVGEDADAQDAQQKITDQLRKIPMWWFLEIIPTSHTFKDREGRWKTIWRPNRGSGRRVPPNAKFHTSVKTRMDKLIYKPKAEYDKDQIEYVS